MLPASECVFSITITEASLGFTNGSDVSLYGRSMPLKSWLKLMPLTCGS